MYRIQNDYFNLRKIAESGQIFRLRESSPGSWTLNAGSDLLRLTEASDGSILTDCPDQEWEDRWQSYFDLDADYGAYEASIPDRDPYLKAAWDYGRGIRILRQDPWEMLITFIISQRKSIPAITRCVETLSARFGTRIAHTGGPEDYAFPTPDQLGAASEAELRECALGYRAPYLARTTEQVVSGRFPLEALKLRSKEELPDKELLDLLLTLPGVGIKVANCVLLFGFHRLASFPRDVWIRRVEDEHYRGHFPERRYRGYAGVMQQFLFYYGKRKEHGTV